MVLLITPNTKQVNYGLTSHEYSAIQPNIYMNLLESVFNNVKKIPCKSIHMEADKMTYEQLHKYIRYSRPDKVIIICSGSNPSASTMTMGGAIPLCKFIKRSFPNIHLAIWGGHPTVMPRRTKHETCVDEVIIGDDFGIDPAHIPMVDWNRIDPSKYKAHNWHCFGQLDYRSPYAVIWTSLGCPYKCEFCCINNVFQQRTYRLRKVNDVLLEIDHLVKDHKVRHIKIMDELFVTKNERIEQFCKGLIRRKYNLNMWAFARVDTVTPEILALLKKAGVNWLAYGFESVSQKIINNQKKGSKVADYKKVIKWTRDAGINIIADFIAGFWQDSYDSLNETYDFMCEQNFEFINLYPLFAYPGTPLYEKYTQQGIISVPKNWSQYSLYGKDCYPCPTRHLTPEQVLKWRDEKYVAYYKRSEYLAMIKKTFGPQTHKHVMGMTRQQLVRNHTINCT